MRKRDAVPPEQDRVVFDVPREVLDALPVLVSYVDRALVYRYCNSAYHDWLGRTRDQIVGQPVREVIGEAGFGYALSRMERALQGEVQVFQTMAPFRGGDLRHVQATYRPDVTSEGAVLGFYAIVEDMTSKQHAEEILAATLDVMADGYMTLDSGWRIHHFNAAAERIYDLKREDVLGRHVDDIWLGATESPTGLLIQKAFESGEAQRGEVDTVQPPARTYIAFVFPLSSGGVGMLFEDITERKAAARRLELLNSELNHRVKNTLAIVQAITRQTLTGAGIEENLREAIEGRIRALASAQDALTRGNWESVMLGDLVEAASQPFRVREGSRFTVSGPEVRLNANSAVALSLAIHELATNAVKYGALSCPEGRVTVCWNVDPANRLTLSWTESGGPRIAQPVRRGFGSRLIDALGHDLGGEAVVDYPPDGVRCTLNAPLPA